MKTSSRKNSEKRVSPRHSAKNVNRSRSNSKSSFKRRVVEIEDLDDSLEQIQRVRRSKLPSSRKQSSTAFGKGIEAAEELLRKSANFGSHLAE
jgi:hypothetical protein